MLENPIDLLQVRKRKGDRVLGGGQFFRLGVKCNATCFSRRLR